MVGFLRILVVVLIVILIAVPICILLYFLGII